MPIYFILCDTSTPKLETIHKAQTPIFILDAVCQVHAVLVMRAVVVAQLCPQHRLMGRALELQIDRGGVFGEVLGAPRELAWPCINHIERVYGAEMDLPFLVPRNSSRSSSEYVASPLGRRQYAVRTCPFLSLMSMEDLWKPIAMVCCRCEYVRAEKYRTEVPAPDERDPLAEIGLIGDYSRKREEKD